MKTMKLFFGLMMIASLLFGTGAVSFAKTKRQMKFKVRIENISTGEQMNPSGTKYPFALSPGMYVVSEKEMPLFKVGKKAAMGIEMQAEDGNPMGLIEALSGKVGNARLGFFNKPVGAEMPAPILPGGAFEFEVDAVEGQKLTLTTMFGQSNDLFYAPSKAINLFEKGQPLSGDITDKLMLWDAGTEVNEEPGTGANQAPRQKMANMGMDEKSVVKLVTDNFKYPDTKSVLRVTVTPVN
ncbi:MAG TPA: spondin domain-containing protein [Pyrinomonadaceae bacterium]|nr:spondin domain-containing protein [Pyrinomonadaceae bacterium]